MTINTRLGGKNLYWEILTVSYARPDSEPLTRVG